MSAAANTNPVLTITEAPPLSKTAAKAIERAEKAVARAAAKAAKAAAKAAQPKRPRGRPRKGTAAATAAAVILPPSEAVSHDDDNDGSTIMDNMSAHSSVHFDADSESEVSVLRAELSELKARHAALELAYQKAANSLDAIRKVLTLSSL
jgi:hypothetical protein